jgi:hypothetical protein
MEGALCDILWSDPLNEDETHKLTDEEYSEVSNSVYVLS